MPRPRSIEAHRKVLEAAVRLFAKDGIDATSMDAVAGASGVSKATIYKHWPDKDQLALEVLGWLFGLEDERPEFHSVDLRSDLLAALSYEPAEDRKALKEQIMPHLIAYSARNQVFGHAWRQYVVQLRRDQLSQVLNAAIARSELEGSLNFDAAIALLVGPMMYRQIFVAKKRTDKPPREFIEQIVDAFCKSFGTSRKNGRRPRISLAKHS